MAKQKPLRYPPNGCWPLMMRADMAAAYVDERSVQTFLNKVGTHYPRSAHGAGTTAAWRKSDLDVRTTGSQTGGEELAELI